jgi:hypothetical protein
LLQYIIVEFIPSIILLYPSFISGIVSTDLHTVYIIFLPYSPFYSLSLHSPPFPLLAIPQGKIFTFGIEQDQKNKRGKNPS